MKKISGRLLEARVALVTGAGSGIGRASALAFAREGARVIVSDISVDGGKETVELIKASGGNGDFLQADVSDESQVRALVTKTVEVFGRLDCAHNNAGVLGGRKPTAEYDLATWSSVLTVNLTGVFLCMKYELAQMLRRGGGAIVNTASMTGLVGVRNLPAYVASKHGVVGLTKAAALEYAQSGIRINAVCPGTVRTPMLEPTLRASPEAEERYRSLQPIGRMTLPEEIAEAVVWLCSDRASTVTGHAMAVDGGYVAQ